jgi:branched-chain amino acid transport system permease protein
VRGRILRVAVPAAVFAAGAALAFGLSDSQLTVYALLLLAAVVATGLSLFTGYAGQVSLGQGGFTAVGAYTAALVSVHGGSSLLGLVAAPVAAVVVAGVVGIPLLRLRGNHLAFATLAFQLILLSLIGRQAWLGGDTGLSDVPRLTLGPLAIVTPRDFALLALALLAAAMLATRDIVASRSGRALRALADSEAAAQASGVAVGRYRLAAFLVAAALAGASGGVYTFFIGYLAPDSFPLLTSIEYLVMAVVGGLATLWGPAIGAALLTLLTQLLNNWGTRPGLPAYLPAVLSYAGYALVLILTVWFLPRGLVPALARRGRSRIPGIRTGTRSPRRRS